MTAEERLRFYASRFPLTEVDSTYYAPPGEQQARLWAQRTPAGFRFDVKAYSLLTGHPTRPQSLWSDLREQLPAQTREKRNVYAHHLPADALWEAWRRFELALRPLHEAGRLGAVLFQYPPWFTPRRESRAEIEALGSRLPDYRIAVEFRSPRWLAEERRPRADPVPARGARACVRVRRRSRGVRAAAAVRDDQPGAGDRSLPRPLGQRVGRARSDRR